MEHLLFLVGSSDEQQQHSLYMCDFDPGTGDLNRLDSFPGAISPNYLALSPDGKLLYTVDNTLWDSTTGHQTISVFARDGGDGDDTDFSGWTFQTRLSSEGSGPCHILCAPSGRGLFVANYGSGNLAYFRLGEDGLPAGPPQVLSSDGTGPVSGRQEGPHTHQVLLDPESRYLLVPDLGSDRIRSYVYEERLGTLEPNPAQPFLALPPGSGPRHLVFHPGGTFLYIASELSSTVTACRYDASTGRMNILQELSTVEDTHRGTKYPAAIRISPDGRFVYVSTRGAEQNCVSVFEADPENGTLTPVQYLNDIPAWPRDFNLTPSGSHLLVAGERGNQIAAFAVDSVSGRLAPVGKPMALPAPGCILFDE